MASSMSDKKSAAPSALEVAIQAGCAAADVHLTCSYPECGCKQIPTAIAVAVGKERARILATVKHWFGGDDIFDQGYECVREIENG